MSTSELTLATGKPKARTRFGAALLPQFRWRGLRYGMLTVVALLMSFPFIWMLITTFKTSSSIFTLPPTFIPDKLFQPDMFSSYSVLFTEYNFARYTLNSFYVSLMASIGQIVTCSLAAFAFARMEFKGKNLLFGLMLATALIPLEVTIIPEFLLAVRIFDPLLKAVGGAWMDTFNPLIIPSFLIGTTGTFLLREFFSTLPREMEEAAVVDGATAFQIYRHIYLPLSMPALVTLFLLAFINNWNPLLRATIYLKSPDLRTLPIGLTSFQTQYSAEWDLLLSGSVVTLLPLIIIYILMQRYIVEGISTTGLRG